MLGSDSCLIHFVPENIFQLFLVLEDLQKESSQRRRSNLVALLFCQVVKLFNVCIFYVMDRLKKN